MGRLRFTICASGRGPVGGYVAPPAVRTNRTSSIVNRRSQRLRAAGLAVLLLLIACLAGCNNKFFDPTQVGRFRPTPAVNVILDSLGVAEETPVAWEEAETPKPGDIVAVKTDYTLRPGDIVRISIFELYQEGVPLVNDYVVSESGRISIPEIGVVQAAGLTETQLEEELRQILSPAILRQPSVTVTLMSSQQRTFSILGNAVPRAGRYTIPRYDFRLTDALAMGGAQTQFNVSYVYVSRREEWPPAGEEPADVEPQREREPQGSEMELIEPGQRPGAGPAAPPPVPQTNAVTVPGMGIPEPTEPAEPYELEREMLELISPQAQDRWPQTDKVVGGPPREEEPEPAGVQASAIPEGYRLLVPSRRNRPRERVPEGRVIAPSEFGPSGPPGSVASASEGEERIEWIFHDGRWIPVPVNGEPVPQTPTAPPEEGELEWVFRDGRWISVPRNGDEAPTTTEPPVAPPEGPPIAPPEGPGLPPDDDALPMEREWAEAIQTRLIRIPADKLLAGDPRYNIVIKPGDTVHVPVDIIGEFAIMGNVNRSGFINITGRQMTLKMAIAAAGGLGPLAWPKHVEVVRRIGRKKEEIVLVDLDKIASGEQPDFFIKPNDLINVGTHATSRWRAVLRNAFRAAYGFGFVYDRNFADADFGKGFELPSWL